MQSPDWLQPIEIICDTSDYMIGAVLGLQRNKKSYIVYYACKTLNNAQMNYKTIEKGLLDIVFNLDKFHKHILAHMFLQIIRGSSIYAKKDAKP